jgi:hypothetical protein
MLKLVLFLHRGGLRQVEAVLQTDVARRRVKDFVSRGKNC